MTNPAAVLSREMRGYWEFPDAILMRFSVI